MHVLAHQRWSFIANGAVTKSSALRAAGHNADVLRHGETVKGKGQREKVPIRQRQKAEGETAKGETGKGETGKGETGKLLGTGCGKRRRSRS
jgi:hypothetical protein